MSVITTIFKAFNDTAKPSEKCYAGANLKFRLVNAGNLRNRSGAFYPTEKRLLQTELSGIEPIRQYFVIRNDGKNGILTREQVREIFMDLGFHIDPIMSKPHGSDFAGVMNINGYIIPGWHWICKKIFRISTKLEKLFLLKLAPGKERLHIRASHNNDGTWIVTAHTEINWFHFNLFKAVRAHATVGAGDYVTGTAILKMILTKYIDNLRMDKPISFSEIEKITRHVHYESFKKRVCLKVKRVLK